MTRVLTEARVRSNRTVARDTVILGLDVPLPQPPRPGQFAMVHPLSPECLLPRPFSILAYDRGRLDILVKDVGVGSRALCRAQVGDAVRVFAPLGSSFLDHSELLARPVVLVAGGVGIVPLFWLAEELEAQGRPYRALLGARTDRDLPRALIESGRSAWEFWVEQDPAPDSQVGLVTQGLARALDAQPEAQVATCGPTPMMHAVHDLATQHGRALWVCLEEQMGCGAGVCRACVIPARDHHRMRTVCKEGPVFNVDQIQFAAGPA